MERPILLSACLNIGSAGDSPAPVGESPTGTTQSKLGKRLSPLARTVAPIPSGESPDGTGESPVLPKNGFSNTLKVLGGAVSARSPAERWAGAHRRAGRVPRTLSSLPAFPTGAADRSEQRKEKATGRRKAGRRGCGSANQSSTDR